MPTLRADWWAVPTLRMADTKRILIFGGTFDPPHRAHIELPALIAERLGCDRIIYVPAARSPFKTEATPTADEDRLAMLRLAIGDVPNAEISTIELDRGGVSYFIDTIEALRGQYGDDVELRFLMGADQALEFNKWKDWRRILELATPAVMLRPPWEAASFRAALRDSLGEEDAACWMEWTVDVPLLDISASVIRAQLARGEGAVEGLDPVVAQYIAEHHLYRD